MDKGTVLKFWKEEQVAKGTVFKFWKEEQVDKWTVLKFWKEVQVDKGTVLKFWKEVQVDLWINWDEQNLLRVQSFFHFGEISLVTDLK